MGRDDSGGAQEECAREGEGGEGWGGARVGLNFRVNGSGMEKYNGGSSSGGGNGEERVVVEDTIYRKEKRLFRKMWGRDRMATVVT